MDLCKLDDYLKHVVGVGRRPVDDSFFNETYKACNVFHKTGITVEDDEDLCHQVMKEFPCNFLDCDEVFHNLADYEIHYNGSHRYSCEECRITRPNSRLLEIHIQETHDKFFEISSQKRPMYQCFVVECHEKFASPEERSGHCTTIHKFPKNFNYGSEELKIGELETLQRERIGAAPTSENPMEISSGNTSQCKSMRSEIDNGSRILSIGENEDTTLEPNCLRRSGQSILESNNLMDLLDKLPD
ncbi:zinc finger protein 511 isoform X1 [Venturia canescens]|uniref:zinc finger protein 511 isoform X1 n=1 Tax=Venturia canescens TaxID=32260 RepID=UPI001C9BD729|nr:zinc finger protein 511 isoform X1 [Venturia canescens]